MKFKVSLSLKLTLIVILLSTVIIFSLSAINIYMQIEREKDIFKQTTTDLDIGFAKSHNVTKILDEALSNYDNLNNTENLYKNLSELKDSFQEKYSWVENINVIRPTQNGLLVNVSTDPSLVGSFPNTEYDNESYINGSSYYIIQGNILTIISPINISGEIVGTYEIILHLSARYVSYDAQIQYIVIISFISIFILIFSMIYLLRRSIVKPVVNFRDTARVFGKGNLDARVDIKSKDELGDLASAFNQMAKDLKESRDKIQDYNQILENLLQQKDEFIGQLGHDLKNPMQPLVGLLPILIEKEKDPEIKEALVIMNKNVEYMQDLIFKTLQLAKLRSSKIKFDFENLNLKKEADYVISLEQINLKEHKIELENNIDDKIIVNADKLRLAEVLKNLISNAVKYIPDGGGKIFVDAEKTGDVVKVSIRDTGIGMTEDQLKKMFDEFYKADVSLGDYQSTGLGLAICKKIVEKHDGKIWVESPGLGKGSTFFFTLKSGDEN